MTASFNKFQPWVAYLGSKTELMTVGGDTIKFALVSVQPVNTWSLYSSLTEVASGNGYTTGGNAGGAMSWTQTGGTLKWIIASPTLWTCITNPMGPFQWVVGYDSTTTHLFGWWDYGVACTLQVADTFTVTLDGTNGVLQIA